MLAGGLGFVFALFASAFNLLLGRSPGDITGGAEGLVLGASVWFGLWFCARDGLASWMRRSLVGA